MHAHTHMKNNVKEPVTSATTNHESITQMIFVGHKSIISSKRLA